MPIIGVVCDVALDLFCSDGQDGIVRDGRIVNDESVEALVQQAIVQTEAGVVMVAPSDMMDGRIGAIRARARRLGLPAHEQIMAYAAKYASAFWGPFRDAIGGSGDSAAATSGPTRWIRPTRDEALREVGSTSPKAPTW